MKRASLVLGLIGGLLGILAGLIVIVGGGAVGAFVDDGGMWLGMGFATFALAVAGTVGAAVAESHALASGTLQLLAGIAGFVTAGGLWLLSGPLLIVAGVLVWVQHDRDVRARAASF